MHVPLASSVARDVDLMTVFDLPREILASLQPAIVSSPSSSDREFLERPRLEDTSHATRDDSSAMATSCAMCALSFANVQDQRTHVRSDLHAYNLKRKLRGFKPVPDVEFEKLVGGV